MDGVVVTTKRFLPKFLFCLWECGTLLLGRVLLKKEARLKVARLAHFLGFQPDVIPRAEKTDYWEIGGSPESQIALGFGSSKIGDTSFQEIAILSSLVRHFQPKTIFEFGTANGFATLNFALNSGAETKIYTLDIGRPDDMGSLFKKNSAREKIIQLQGDSTFFDFTPYKNSVDFIFIDANHSRKNVYTDSQSAIQLIGDRKGIILWHDYSAWEGVTEALEELRQTDDRFRKLRWMNGTTLACLMVNDR